MIVLPAKRIMVKFCQDHSLRTGENILRKNLKEGGKRERDTWKTLKAEGGESFNERVRIPFLEILILFEACFKGFILLSSVLRVFFLFETCFKGNYPFLSLC